TGLHKIFIKIYYLVLPSSILLCYYMVIQRRWIDYVKNSTAEGDTGCMHYDGDKRTASLWLRTCTEAAGGGPAGNYTGYDISGAAASSEERLHHKRTERITLRAEAEILFFKR